MYLAQEVKISIEEPNNSNKVVLLMRVFFCVCQIQNTTESLFILKTRI
jgi:hypothetical protein